MNEITVKNSRNKLIRKIDYSDRTMTLDLDLTDRLDILVYDLMHLDTKEQIDEDSAREFINLRFKELFNDLCKHQKEGRYSYLMVVSLENYIDTVLEYEELTDDVKRYVCVLEFMVNELKMLNNFKNSEDGSCMKMIQINYIVDDKIVSAAFDKFDTNASFKGNQMKIKIV